tara:strand:+ start:29663 stop:30145 length:483 start_codon:yes stop_codon:yes gene_type:complete
MIGAYAVGKTSLVDQFVLSIYSDAYHTTVGVKIDKKVLQVNDTELTCVIWDIAGEDEFYTVSNSYLRGMAGFFLVVDSTRNVTVKIALSLLDRIQETYPNIPFIVLLNKTDLVADRDINNADLALLKERAIDVIETSAKTGIGVEHAFQDLANSIISSRP